MKIRLHMLNTKCNYKSNKSDRTYPLCRTEKDTIEHIMVCQEGNNTYNLLGENEKNWKKIVPIYKNNKRNTEKLEQQKSAKGKYIQ